MACNMGINACGVDPTRGTVSSTIIRSTFMPRVATKEHKEHRDSENRKFLCVLCAFSWQFRPFSKLFIGGVLAEAPDVCHAPQNNPAIHKDWTGVEGIAPFRWVEFLELAGGFNYDSSAFLAE